MRADEHEGELNDSEVKRQNDRANSRAAEILRNDALALTESGSFLRFFSRYAYPALYEVPVSVDHGSRLAEFMGKRALIIEISKEMDAISPGFYQRMLQARDDYARELQRAAQGPRSKEKS